MVFPSLLLPGPSASHFCAYSSAPSQTKPSKKKKKKKSTNLKINRFAHLLNSSIIRRLGVNAVLSHAAGLSAFRSCHSTEFVMVSSGRMPVFVRLPRFQTCWLWPRLFVCMFSASSVIKMCQSHVRQPAPKTGPGIPSYSHECLSNLCLPTFGFHGEKKKKRCRKWSFASLPTCQVKPSPTKWTLSSPDMMGDSAHTCQSVSGTHLPTCPSTAPRGAILLFTHAGWWEGALHAPVPPPKNRPRVSCPSWQQRVFLVMTHCQEATQSSNLPRYLPSKF